METKLVSHYRLPYPPTVNTYWRHLRKYHRTIISKAGRRYKDEVRAALANQGATKLKGRIALRIIAYMPDKRKRDLDNILKALLDALSPHLYEDDSQIDEIRILRGNVHKGGSVFLEIRPTCSEFFKR